MSSYRLSVRAPPWFPAPPPALAVEEGAGLVLGWRYSAHPPLAAPPALLHTGPGGAVRRVAGLGSNTTGGEARVEVARRVTPAQAGTYTLLLANTEGEAASPPLAGTATTPAHTLAN